LGKEKWSTSSPGLNPLGNCVWAFVEQSACKKSHTSLVALMTSIRKIWASITADYIIKVCAAFKGALDAILKANGAHIE